jgi:hypothetical protein
MIGGAALGYEIYATSYELLDVYRGIIRKEMIAHHIVVILIFCGVLQRWKELPVGDEIYWLPIYASLVLLLATNCALNLRSLCYGTRFSTISSAIFAFQFLKVRVHEQIPFVIDAWNGPIKSYWITGVSPFEDAVTPFLFAGWLALEALQLFWAARVVMMCLKTLGLTKAKKKED